MQPSALEARGYTLPTTTPRTSKHPESAVGMKACPSRASKLLSRCDAFRSTGAGWWGGSALSDEPKRLLASASKHWAQRSARGCGGCWIKRRSCHPICLWDREPNPVLGLTNSPEGAQQKATSVLRPGSPKPAAKPPTDKELSREARGLCSVPAAALLSGICRLQRDGCTQLCQSVSTSELTIAERQMTCYIFSYL